MSCALNVCSIDPPTDCPKYEECLLARRSADNRAGYNEAIATQQRSLDNRQQFTGVVGSFDAQSRSYVVQVEGGGVVRAQSNSNADIIGNKVSVTVPLGTQRGWISSPPSVN